MLNEKIKKVVEFGDRFIKEYLSKEYFKTHNIDIEKVESDWWEASKFFFSRAFYQGRRDDISKKVEEKAIEILSKYFDNQYQRDKEFQRLKDTNWKELKNELSKNIGKGKIGRERDIKMIISYFNFISNLEHKNIVAYSLNKIKQKEIKDHFYELQKSKRPNGIESVGPKITSLYLRDLVCINNLEDSIKKEDMIYFQPIDTWVRKIANELEIIESPKLSNKELKNVNEFKIREKIVEICDKLHVSAIKFNQGAWYLGVKSFNILLENLEKL
jgi:hypothetical protein